MENFWTAYHNYILTFALVLLIGFLFALRKRNLIKNAALSKATKALTVTAIIAIAFALILFPDLKSVETTGEYAYASCVLELTDTSRPESFKNDGSFRTLSALVYYPAGRTACPMVVFSHGGISTKTSNLSLYKELASHGYVVISIDHTYHALSARIGGKTVYIDPGYMKELSSEDSHLDPANSYACYQKWM